MNDDNPSGAEALGWYRSYCSSHCCIDLEFEMILPPLQSHDHPDFPSMKWTDLEMDAIKEYALLAIKTVCGGKHRGPKFSERDVAIIRSLHEQGFAYKTVNRQIEMSEATFYNITKRRGAYK